MKSNDTFTPGEKTAMADAQRAFQAYLEEKPNSREPHDRKAFNALGSAVDSLRDALSAFADVHGPNRPQLLYLLQVANLCSRDEYEEMLAQLQDGLELLACAAAAEPANGDFRKEDSHVWVRIAAEQWLKTVGKEPGAKKSRFLRALKAIGVRDPRLRVGDDLVETAVKEWRLIRR